jgi:predicted kinase
MVTIVFGLPGSGKSYFASRLAERISARYISSDRVRMEMLPVRTYSEEEKMLVYKEMLNRVREAEIRNMDVVLDATFYKDAIRKQFPEGIKSPIRWIEITADERTVHRRLQRSRETSEADYKAYLKIREQWEPLVDDHLVLHSDDNNIEAMLKTAVHYLSTPNDQ